jgi:hypothetical protein
MTFEEKVQIQFDPTGYWIGVLWKKNHIPNSKFSIFHIMFSIIPMMPLHITLLLRKSTQGN